MTDFEEQAKEFSQRPVAFVDILAPFCSLRYGSGICAPDSRELFQIEGSSGWVGSADAAVADDDTWRIRGVRSVKVDKTGATEATVSVARADLEETGDLTGRSLRFAYNLGAILGSVTEAFIRLGDATETDYYEWTFPVAGLKEGLNLLTFEFDSPSSTTGTPPSVPELVRFGLNVTGAGVTFTDSWSFDDFILLSANPQAAPCYNTRATCRDAAHFFTQKTTKTWRFSVENGPVITGADGPSIIPCVKGRGIKLIPTRIDQERGYGRRDKIQIDMTDFEDDDRLTDPYLSLRPNDPASTFWRKFFVRNPYLKNRPLILREGFGIDDPETGKVRVDLDQFKVRRYILDTLNGPNKRGVSIVGKDLLKGLEGFQIPRASEAELFAEIDDQPTTTVLTFTDDSVDNILLQWQEAAFSLPGAALFYIRIDDEIMLVTAAVSGSNTMTVIRAQLGTEIAEHEADAKVQMVQSWVDIRVDDIWNDIQVQANIDPTFIAYADAVAEADENLSEFILVRHVSVPTKCDQLMKDLNSDCATVTFWDAEDQVTRLKAIAPPAAGEVVPLWTDETTVVGSSIEITRREEKRITNATIYHSPINWAASLTDAGNFLRGVLFIDADAESEDQYDDEKNKTFFASFFPSGLSTTVRSIAARYVAKFRDPLTQIKLRVTNKDAVFVKPGNIVDLKTFGLVDFDGQEVVTRTLVVSKKRLDPIGLQWEFELEDFEFAALRFAFWAPDDAPDFDVATDADKEFAYWAGEDCLMPDGSDPYLWV